LDFGTLDPGDLPDRFEGSGVFAMPAIWDESGPHERAHSHGCADAGITATSTNARPPFAGNRGKGSRHLGPASAAAPFPRRTSSSPTGCSRIPFRIRNRRVGVGSAVRSGGS
jgi:hypothetical protein